MFKDNIEKFNDILRSFKIEANCQSFQEFKNACFYDIELKPGARVHDLEKYSNEFSLILKSQAKPRVNILYKKGLVRLEFIKSLNNKIKLFDLGKTVKFPEGDLVCLLGETVEANPLWLDITKAPHILIGGCTGSGKSSLLHSFIANLLLYPNVKLFLMDPKNIEFYKYADMNNSKLQVSYDYFECLGILEYLVQEMNNRYLFMRDNGVAVDYFPYMILIIDEFADLIMQDNDRRFYQLLCQLAQKSRAAGIHIILSTQRPSYNIVDGSIKASFPSRISCKVASGVDSRVILDASGAEHLVGHGDAIIKNNDYGLQRFQAAFTTPEKTATYFGYC